MSETETQPKSKPEPFVYKPIRLRIISEQDGMENGTEYLEESTDAARLLVERGTAVPAAPLDKANLERQVKHQRQEQEEFERKRAEQLRLSDQNARNRFEDARRNRMMKPAAVLAKS